MDTKGKTSLGGDFPRPEAPLPKGRVVDSRDLLGSRDELLIRHEGRLYRLRRTRLGKLILTA